jgi:hypothetical protein
VFPAPAAAASRTAFEATAGAFGAAAYASRHADDDGEEDEGPNDDAGDDGPSVSLRQVRFTKSSCD